MKKMILFIAALLLIGTTAQATDQLSDHQDRVTKRYHQAQPIVFIQNGVKFLVYPNGEVDFRTVRNRSRNHTWSSHRGFNTPGGYYGYTPRSRHGFVRYDYYGRLKKVGLNYLTYDRYNRVRRIGSIYIQYNRRGLAHQIGGLYIYYNRHGNIRHVEGNVYDDGCGFCGIDGCSIGHDPYYNQNWRAKRYDDDRHHYKNRKRNKRYHDDDDDDRDDD